MKALVIILFTGLAFTTTGLSQEYRLVVVKGGDQFGNTEEIDVGPGKMFTVLEHLDNGDQSLLHVQLPGKTQYQVAREKLGTTFKGPATIQLSVPRGNEAAVVFRVFDALDEMMVYEDQEVIELPQGMYVEVLQGTASFRPEGADTTFRYRENGGILPGPGRVVATAGTEPVIYRMRINPGAPGPADGTIEIGIEQSESLDGPWTETRPGLRDAKDAKKFLRATVRNRGLFRLLNGPKSEEPLFCTATIIIPRDDN